MKSAILSLFKSRKFLLAVLSAVQAIVLNYFNVDPEVWLSISGVFVILIHSIAVEDAAAKSAESQKQTLTVVAPSEDAPGKTTLKSE